MTHDLNRCYRMMATATWTAGAVTTERRTMDIAVVSPPPAVELELLWHWWRQHVRQCWHVHQARRRDDAVFVSSTAVAFNNSGAVEVQGALLLNAGGSNSSTIVLAPGNGIGLVGELQPHGDFRDQWSGHGEYNRRQSHVCGGCATWGAQLNLSGSTVSFASAISFTNVDFSSGTLTGAGDVTITGHLNWSSGTMSGAAGRSSPIRAR